MWFYTSIFVIFFAYESVVEGQTSQQPSGPSTVKLDFGEPGVNVQNGFLKLGVPDGDDGTYSSTFEYMGQTSRINITGYTHTRGNYEEVVNSYAGLSNLLRSSFLRNWRGVMNVEVSGLEPSTMYVITTYHHSTSFPRGGVSFSLQYNGNSKNMLKQSPSGTNPNPALVHYEIVQSSTDGSIHLVMNSEEGFGGVSWSAHMDLNGMEIRYIGSYRSLCLHTLRPTEKPTSYPTVSPTTSPTEFPTTGPTGTPTESPTNSPSRTPSEAPSSNPTTFPSLNPTLSPTVRLTEKPTSSPTGLGTIKLDFGEPGVNVQEGFIKLGAPDGGSGTYSSTFKWSAGQTSTIKITGYTHTRGNYKEVVNSFAGISNLLRSSFFRNLPGMMIVEVFGLEPSTMYEITTYHHSTSNPRGGASFSLQYEGNNKNLLKQSAYGSNPYPPLMHAEIVQSSTDGIIRLVMNSEEGIGGVAKNAHMDLNGMEIKFIGPVTTV